MKFGLQDGALDREARKNRQQAANDKNTTPANPREVAPAQTSPPAALMPRIPTPLTLEPSWEAVARARSASIPPVKKDQGLAGPLNAPQKTLLYAREDGMLTLFHPDASIAYFAAQQPFVWRYAVSHEGYFEFDTQESVVELDAPPEALLAWPQAVPVATAVAKIATQLIAQDTQDAPGAAARREALLAQQQAIWSALSSDTPQLRAATALLLEQMRAPGCQPRVEDDTYVGCF